MSSRSGQNRHGARGRHKKATSRETRQWEREHLIPERPVWMAPETYTKLAQLRDQS